MSTLGWYRKRKNGKGWGWHKKYAQKGGIKIIRAEGAGGAGQEKILDFEKYTPPPPP